VTIKNLVASILIIGTVSAHEIGQKPPSLPKEATTSAPVTVTAYDKAETVDEKKSLLHSAALEKDTDVGEVASAAFTDKLPEVRATAAALVAARCLVAQSASQETRASTWAMFARSRPSLFGLLKEGDEQHRQVAILALVNLELVRPGKDHGIGSDVARALVEMFTWEPSSRVRAEIVKTIALAPVDREPQFGADFLVEAAEDLSDGVQQFAAVGIGRHHIARGLAKLGDLLQSDSRAVRLAAATSIGSFGKDAASLAQGLSLAAAVETDLNVRKVMQMAIARTKGERKSPSST
jgi:HEAT repeat protein